MKEIDIDGLRTFQMEILSYVDEVCKKNGLRYSLCGGSLLGAIRHQGYIPWDDDIDVFLPRPDYEKLVEILESENGRYKVFTCFNKRDYFLPFAKVVDSHTTMKENYGRTIEGLGVNIDLFPEDGLPASDSLRARYWKRIGILKRFNTMVYDRDVKGESLSRRLLRKVMFHVFRCFPANMLAKKINRRAMKHSFEGSEMIACSVFGYGRREEMPHTLFDAIHDRPFEDRTFACIDAYDLYLSSLYGDYMQLPPKEKQVAKHSFEAYLLD